MHCLMTGASGQGTELCRGVGVSIRWAVMAAAMAGHIGGSAPVLSLIIMLSADKLIYICAYSPSKGNQRITIGCL